MLNALNSHMSVGKSVSLEKKNNHNQNTTNQVCSSTENYSTNYECICEYLYKDPSIPVASTSNSDCQKE